MECGVWCVVWVANCAVYVYVYVRVCGVCVVCVSCCPINLEYVPFEQRGCASV